MPEIRANGLTFHVQRLGGGERAVVFLHGLVMDNLSSWYFSVATPAARHADVVLYDLRGHGRSERPPAGYALDDMVADLAAVLDALGMGDRRVDLAGNSYGGTLALAFAEALPERAGRVLLVDGHLVTEGWGEEMASTLRLQGEEAVEVVARNFAAWKGRHSERKRNRLALTARDLIYGTTLVDDLARERPFTPERLRRVHSPVLALYGEHSDIRRRCEPLLRALPDLDLRILPGCTHSVLWEATEELKATVVDWVRR